MPFNLRVHLLKPLSAPMPSSSCEATLSKPSAMSSVSAVLLADTCQGFVHRSRAIRLTFYTRYLLKTQQQPIHYLFYTILIHAILKENEGDVYTCIKY